MAGDGWRSSVPTVEIMLPCNGAIDLLPVIHQIGLLRLDKEILREENESLSRHRRTKKKMEKANSRPRKRFASSERGQCSVTERKSRKWVSPEESENKATARWCLRQDRI